MLISSIIWDKEGRFWQHMGGIQAVRRWEELSQEDLLCASYCNGKLPPFPLGAWEYRSRESCSSSIRV